MDTHRRTPPGYYRADEVATLLRCSAWWIKEQARHRRIPYAWIGGSYLFTDDHVTEIVRLFEVRPADTAPTAPTATATRRRQPTPATAARLVARVPRRARTAAAHHEAA